MEATTVKINKLLDTLTAGHRTGNMIGDLRDLDWHDSNDLADAQCVTDDRGNEVAWIDADGNLSIVAPDGNVIDTEVTL